MEYDNSQYLEQKKTPMIINQQVGKLTFSEPQK